MSVILFLLLLLLLIVPTLPFGIETPLRLPGDPQSPRLNGLGSPFGFEAFVSVPCQARHLGLNGLGSPFGFETLLAARPAALIALAKWPGKPVRV